MRSAESPPPAGQSTAFNDAYWLLVGGGSTPEEAKELAGYFEQVEAGVVALKEAEVRLHDLRKRLNSGLRLLRAEVVKHPRRFKLLELLNRITR